ncbi:sialidase family protein [Frigoriglobus tundricola]|uniref:Retaining sialidase n=1 Tax=Frigoriglobus tundricola TaxID=2774151 RepID=A0A6M5Z6L1_9BACT|nr:sialidase family protein [Frigoriglobus tundricola]QJX01044.1 retaining sialidase [Frigoriglobus tundricola]
MFIFEKAPFPSCHASTVVEHEPGKLMAAWFGGKAEGAKDVQIWASTFDGKAWSEPKVIGTEPGQPCWNPVLFKSAKGTLHFWYKAGPKPDNWTGFARTSTDSGKTWTKVEMMHAGFWGPIRAKPIQLASGVNLAGTSVESFRNWTPYVDRSTDDGKTWKRSNGFPVPEKFDQIQPTLFETKDGRVVALVRSSNPRFICRAESKDGGETFSAAEETVLPNPSAGIDCVKTTDGDVYLIYNPSPLLRTPISLARSTDDGKTWKRVADLETEPGEYSYPAIVQSAAGTLEMTYTWKRTHIKHVSLDPKKYRG